MKKKVCKHCRKEVSGDHQCHFTGGTVYYDSTSDFLTSLVVGSITGDPILGTIIGGDPFGAIVGSAMSQDDKHSSDHSGDSQNDSGPDTSSYSGGSDSGSSDSGSGCDSGGGGGD
ncbi:MAG: hypothetical protein AAB630_03465 [Patescibacteria group bacterium]